MRTFTLVPAPAGRFPENPFWDQISESLSWIDIEGQALCCICSNGAYYSLSMPSKIGFAVPFDDFNFMAGLQDGIYKVSLLSKEIIKFIDHDFTQNHRFNDAKCDQAGRLFIGTMDMSEQPASDNCLYLLEGQKINKVLGELKVSNGIGWGPADDAFYLTDTGNKTIWRYTYNIETGELKDQYVFIKSPMPDGLTVDSEGYVYSVQYGEGAINIYAKDGLLSEIIECPYKNVTSCCFGDKDMKTLYITSSESDQTGGTIFSTRMIRAGIPQTRCELTMQRQLNFACLDKD